MVGAPRHVGAEPAKVRHKDSACEDVRRSRRRATSPILFHVYEHQWRGREEIKRIAMDKSTFREERSRRHRAKTSGPLKREMVSVKGDLLRAAGRRVRKIASLGRRTCGFLKALIWGPVGGGESAAITDGGGVGSDCELVIGVFYSPPA